MPRASSLKRFLGLRGLDGRDNDIKRKKIAYEEQRRKE
jgi:hypothetical protein